MRITSHDPRTFQEILGLIEVELQGVENRLRRQARGSLPILNRINQYLHESGGKRLRPALLLLMSKLCGVGGEAPLQLGMVVELIHVATLVHDDIIDNSEVRRGRPSVNAKWGNQVTVLAGDWLYMTAFWVALKQRDFRILDVLIDITRKMVEGELYQLEQNHRLDVSEEEHLKINWHKTACLFAGCGRLAALLADLEPDKQERLAHYGKCIGMAFQLVDDMLDYTSDQNVVGKPVLKDLEEGKVTLPIIKLLTRARPEEIAFVRQVVEFQQFSTENKQRIIELVRNYDTLGELQMLAEEYARQATESLLAFPDSAYRAALLNLPDLLTRRDN